MNGISRKNSLLIVMGDLRINDYLKGVLLQNYKQIQVDCCWDSGILIPLLAKRDYNCIIVDSSLKDKSGTRLLAHIESRGCSAPIIITCDHEEDLASIGNFMEGAYGYVPKKLIMEKSFQGTLLNLLKYSITMNRITVETRKTLQALELREERYRTIVENSPILILRFAPEDRMISFVNDGFCSYFNTSRYEVLGENFYEIIPDDLTEKISGIIGSLDSINPITTFENHTNFDNIMKWQLWTIQVLCDEKGRILEYQCMGKDITDIKSVQIELETQGKYLQSILDSQDSMIVVTKKDELILSNRSFLNFFGFTSLDELKRKHTSVLDMADDLDHYAIDCDGSEWIEKIIDLNHNDNLIAFRPQYLENPRIFAAHGRKLHSYDERYVISFTDVTELEVRSRKMEQKASYDMLTNIYNRRKFEEILIQELMKIKAGGGLSVIFFDIDFFKKINDTYGHDVGDSVLRELASSVKQSIRNSDIFARWGGEEFIILLPGVILRLAMEVAMKLRKRIKESDFSHVSKISCSFGVTEVRDSDSIATIFKRVDRALYRAKEAGRDRVAVCNNGSAESISG